MLEAEDIAQAVNILVTSLLDKDQAQLDKVLKAVKRVAERQGKRLRTPYEALVKSAVNTSSVVVDGVTRRHMTPLMAAARTNNLHSAHLLLDVGADPNLAADSEGPALMHARSVRCIQALIKRGANVNAECPEYGTVLSHAIRNHWEDEVLQALLDAGADPNRMAASESFARVIEHLHWPRLDETWSKAYRPNGLSNALLWAALTDELPGLQRLIKHGADLELKGGFFGDTALTIAVAAKRPDAVKALLDAKADVNAIARDGHTPLSLAALIGEDGIMRMLLAAGADPSRGKTRAGDSSSQ